MKNITARTARALFLWLCWVVAAGALELPPGAERTALVERARTSYAVPIGPWKDGTIPSVWVEGDLRIEAWRIPGKDLDTLALARSLREQLLSEGYLLRLDCAARECGGFDFRFAIEVLPPPAMRTDLFDYRFLSALRETPAGLAAITILISRTSEAAYVQIAQVIEEGAKSSPVSAPAPEEAGEGPSAPAEGMGARLERDGHVVLDGLSFASGSARLSEGPHPSLAELARYLGEDVARRVVLVGHTDAVGSLEENIALSRARAEAVRERLITRYDADPGQLGAEGVGYLAPRATNLTPEGRKANRRVEAVLLVPR